MLVLGIIVHFEQVTTIEFKMRRMNAVGLYVGIFLTYNVTG